MARVLIADDDIDARKVFGEAIRDGGHAVALAANGIEALRLYSTFRPDVVIVDVFMPFKDGLEVITDLRRTSPGVKIIAISAGWQRTTGDTGVLHDALNMGADVVLPKPLDPDVLEEAVRKLLAQAA